MTKTARNTKTKPTPFDELTGQPRVAAFFNRALDEGRFSHAYLFTGPVGSGKTEAAMVLARVLLCSDDGCGVCDDCRRVIRGKHTDLRIVEPEGVNGYLAEQVRELIHDASRKPVQARGKVYLITRGDLLQGAPANAFLKTIEEPPAGVTFIILARTRDSVLETITSRCVCLAFRQLPEDEAIRILGEKTGVDAGDARIALSVSRGSVARATRFLRSSAQQSLRRETLDKLERLRDADDLSVLHAARDLLAHVKQPLDDLKDEQERELEEYRDLLSKGALSQIEKRHKRELTQGEREIMQQIFQAARSWLRDCLIVAAGSDGADGADASASVPAVVNTDYAHNIGQYAAEYDIACFMRALAAVDAAEGRIVSNVTPQLVIEAMLFEIKESFNA